MLQDSTTRAPLPTPLLDAITGAHLGLRYVRLLRARGAKGHELVAGGAWSLTGEDGEPTEPGEPPTDSPEAIAEVVLAHAAESFAETDSGDRRHTVELVRVVEGGETDTRRVGFKLEEHHEVRASSPKERAEASVMLAQADYIRQLHVHCIGLLRENSNAIRQVSSMLPAMVQLRFDALEDRAEAMLERGGLAKEDKDPAWVRETGATVRTLIKAASPQLAAKLGLDNDDDGAAGLRVKLRELGQTITEEQRPRLVSVLGAMQAAKLMQAGEAASDEDAAEICQSVLDHAGERIDELGALLTEEQTGLLGDIFENIEQILTAKAQAHAKAKQRPKG